MEIRITIIRVYTQNDIKICLLFGNTIIDILGNIVIDYYDLQPLDYFVAGNRYNDVGIDVTTITMLAWQGYKEWGNTQPTIPNIYKN